MPKNISIEHAIIKWRNFSGAPGKYNAFGCRNFCVFLDAQTARNLEEDGWNVRYAKPKESDDPVQPYIQVTVSFDNYPAKVVLISGNKKTQLDKDTVNILDWAEIENVDLIIRPYSWEVNGKTGVKAYLKAIYVTIVEDEFESKYEDLEDSAKSSIGN